MSTSSLIQYVERFFFFFLLVNFTLRLFISSSFPLFFSFYLYLSLLTCFQWRIYYSCDFVKTAWVGKPHITRFMKADGTWGKVVCFLFLIQKKAILVPVWTYRCACSPVSAFEMLLLILLACYRAMHLKRLSLLLSLRV